jgi:mannose-1-phosphate guanylyltransferase
VLAGGIGSRFWPASTPSRPKQLLALASPRALIVDTVERARRLVPDDRLRILAGPHLVPAFRRVLPELPEEAYLIEPRARGTGPVLAWAAHSLLQEDADAVLVSLHADHVIHPDAAFTALLQDACALAAGERMLVTIGVVPDRPETGYGYIQPGPSLPSSVAGALRVLAFHEKPDRATAAGYVTGGYLWNSGIFVWPARVFLDEVRRHAPEIAAHLHLLDEGDVPGFFDTCDAISVDVAVLERSDNVATLASTFTWDDVGGWEALGRTRGADEHGNVTAGETVLVDARNNVVFSEDAPVVLFGVEGLVVVRTGDVTLVTSRDRAPALKELFSRLPAALRDPGSET